MAMAIYLDVDSRVCMGMCLGYEFGVMCMDIGSRPSARPDSINIGAYLSWGPVFIIIGTYSPTRPVSAILGSYSFTRPTSIIIGTYSLLEAHFYHHPVLLLHEAHFIIIGTYSLTRPI
jgi:hypothetical protein